MKKVLSVLFIFLISACNLPQQPLSDPTATFTLTAAPTGAPTATPTAPPTETATLQPTPAPSETPTAAPTDIPAVESLNATVSADLLSCRYGPGAEYLYFYGFKKGTKLKLSGRTDGNNWVMVSGLQHLCWVNAKYIEIQGDRQSLPIAYPGGYSLPVSHYYAAPVVHNATRSGNNVTVNWSEIALRPGDEEDENMFLYIIEIWRCENGQVIFDPLASNYPEVTFVDDGSCGVPLRGRVYFQEKHGFAGPADIPFP